MAAAKKKKTGKSARPDFRWIALIFLVTVLISALMSFVSSNLLEKILRNIIRVCFLRPKQRPYETNNFYAVLERQDRLDKEVYQIVNHTKPDKSRTQKDRRRHRRREAAGPEA